MQCIELVPRAVVPRSDTALQVFTWQGIRLGADTRCTLKSGPNGIATKALGACLDLGVGGPVCVLYGQLYRSSIPHGIATKALGARPAVLARADTF